MPRWPQGEVGSAEGRVSIARWNPKGMRRSTGPQSMGAAPTMNRSAKGGARSSLHYGGEGVLIHPPHQGVCGWHGMEEQRVTSGGLTGSPGGSGASKPISESFERGRSGRLFTLTVSPRQQRSSQHNDHGIAFQHVARFRVFQRSQKCRAQQQETDQQSGPANS
jgi:hypothetical protein